MTDTTSTPADTATGAAVRTPWPDASGDGTGRDTGARTEAAAVLITETRARIDDLDERIIALVRERTAVSAAIQRSRIASGGRRVNLSRETRIVGRYNEALGRPGTALAMTLLELGRGHV